MVNRELTLAPAPLEFLRLNASKANHDSRFTIYGLFAFLPYRSSGAESAASSAQTTQRASSDSNSSA